MNVNVNVEWVPPFTMRKRGRSKTDHVGDKTITMRPPPLCESVVSPNEATIRKQFNTRKGQDDGCDEG